LIDLNRANFSDIGGGVSNLSIAYAAVIENAIGGLGDDTTPGGNAGNSLVVNLGADFIYAGEGE
jgi:serralysin